METYYESGFVDYDGPVEVPDYTFTEFGVESGLYDLFAKASGESDDFTCHEELDVPACTEIPLGLPQPVMAPYSPEYEPATPASSDNSEMAVDLLQRADLRFRTFSGRLRKVGTKNKITHTLGGREAFHKFASRVHEQNTKEPEPPRSPFHRFARKNALHACFCKEDSDEIKTELRCREVSQFLLIRAFAPGEFCHAQDVLTSEKWFVRAEKGSRMIFLTPSGNTKALSFPAMLVPLLDGEVLRIEDLTCMHVQHGAVPHMIADLGDGVHRMIKEDALAEAQSYLAENPALPDFDAMVHDGSVHLTWDRCEENTCM